jgi:magnesium-transporting ATPase (P-type)
MFKCDKCNAELEPNAKFCTNCGEKISEETTEIINNKYEGLGGWLILVGIGLVISPLILLAKLSKVYLPMFNDGTWEALTTLTSESYNSSFLSFLLAGEMFFSSLMTLASLYLIYLFFTKKSFFPKLYIWILVFSLIIIPLDAILASSIFPNKEVFDAEKIKEIGRIVLVSLVWIPYMLISKRVKATFVN